MIYRPSPPLRLWDTWMLKVESHYHLFTLSWREPLPHWDRVCHAVSRDLIHWEDWPDIILEEKENKEAWDAGAILTGSTFKCDRGYAMTYGAIQHGGNVQRIGLVFSEDLRTWEKCKDNPVLVAAGPFYEHDPNATTESSIAWRDAYVTAIDGGYEAVIAANDSSKPKTVNGCVARVRSKDLIHWELLAPMASPGRYWDMEVPQQFELNGRHYILFSTGGGIDTASRVESCGTYYLMANSKHGEYHVPDDNLLIGSGEQRFDCYVGRVIFDESGPLLYHHINGKRTALAMPKVLQQNADGTLWLQRWKGLDALLGEQIISHTSPANTINAFNHVPIGQWKVQDDRLIGAAGPAITGWLFEQPLEDCAISVTIDLAQAGRAGVLFHVANVELPRPGIRGLALCLNSERNVIQLCEVELESRRSVRLMPLDTVHLKPKAQSKVEIFLRAEYVEIYCDDRPLFVLNAEKYPIGGKTGFFVDRGAGIFQNVDVKIIPYKLR